MKMMLATLYQLSEYLQLEKLSNVESSVTNNIYIRVTSLKIKNEIIDT
ncbi:hypothetical protein [Psychromonas hadalis]|nr:hypothetical protein [Psychromonas hadalis]